VAPHPLLLEPAFSIWHPAMCFSTDALSRSRRRAEFFTIFDQRGRTRQLVRRSYSSMALRRTSYALLARDRTAFSGTEVSFPILIH
jgi:hypothetical protein